MVTLWQDLQYGFRMLRKDFTVTAVAVLALALGIGANSAIFSVVNAVILRPLPYKDPERLVALWEIQPRAPKASISAADFLDWKEQTQVFEHVTAYSGQSFNLTNVDQPERIEGAIVSTNFFQTLGVNAALGRTFTPDASQPSGNRMVVVGHGLWQRRFGADPNLVGRALTLNDESFTVVGIMPPGFQFPEQADLWAAPQRIVPEPPIIIRGDVMKMRGLHYLGVLARLKPGVVVKQAQADTETIVRRLEQQYPDTNKGHGVRLTPLHEEMVGEVRLALLTLLGAVGFVLLIACANVANLLLARAVVRQKEFAIRVALGAGRLRLIRQLLTESVLLSLIGGAFGLLLAYWGTHLLVAMSPGNIPRLKDVGLDGAVLVATLLISLLTGIGFGLAPALQASKTDLNHTLKEGGRSTTGGHSRHRFRSALVVAEVALGLVLLIGAGLMIKSFLRLQQVNLGFRPENVLTMQIALSRSKYSDQHKVVAFYNQVLQRIGALPGVQSVGAINNLPLSRTSVSGGFIKKDHPSAPGEQLMAEKRVISPDYFRAMSISLKKGRPFTEGDANGAHGVAIINETMARRFWPDEDPIGKYLSTEIASPKWLEIIGVVGDVRHFGVHADPKPEIYTPYFQSPWHTMTLVARTAAHPSSLATAFRDQVLAVSKNQPVYNIKALEQILFESVAQPRFNMILLGSFAAVALILAAVGIYGVMASSVTQRTHEIGIRMALGARPGDVLKMIIGQGMLLALAGLLTGLCLAFVVTRVMSTLLFGVSATDPVTFLGISVFLASVALVSTYIPAHRATKIDPMVALRCE